MQQGYGAVVQRHVQILAAPGCVPLIKRHQDRNHRVQARAHIDNWRAQPGRAAGRRAVDGGHAADRLYHRVIAWIAAHGAGRAIAGDMAMDQAGELDRQYFLIAQAPFRHLAGLEVLNHHIRTVEQLEQDLLAFLIFLATDYLYV